MATEYYIVKPEQKKIFYLGKRISCLEGLNEWSYLKKADYATWECWEDVVFDLQENSRYFLEGGDMTIGQMWDFCDAIYEFCNDKVYLDNDCSDNFVNWKDWECEDVFDQIFDRPLTELEAWSELFLLVPPEHWYKTEENGISVVHEFETVKNYLQKIKEEKLEQVKGGANG